MSDAAMLSLDTELLSRAAPAQVAAYIREQLRTNSEAAVSLSLLHLIDIEAVPSDVSRIWLSITKDAHSLLLALEQKHSARVRHYAIQRFAAWLRSNKWRTAWEALGGAPGITQLLSGFSVSQVHMFTRIVGRSVRGKLDATKIDKRMAVTELLLLLVPHLSPTADPLTVDSRDLVHLYSALLPACTSEIVAKVLFGPQMAMTLRGDQRHLLREHASVFVQATSPAHASQPSSKWIDQDKHLPRLLLAVAHNTSSDNDSTKLDRFLTITIDQVLSETSNYGRTSSITSCKTLFKRLVERRGLEPSLRKRMLQIILHALSKQNERVRSIAAGLHKQAVCSWSQAPSTFEPILEELFRLLHAYQKHHTFTLTHKHVPRTHRWELLKLIFRAGHPATDLDDDDQLQQLLASDRSAQAWPVTSFLALPPLQALRFMERLATHLPRNRMISTGPSDSILGFGSQHYLQFDMVRFELQLDSVSDERTSVATQTVQDLMARVSRSSNADDRQDLARAALHWAICSRSLELYTRTVVWLRRFVSDVNVARALFSEDSLYKREAIRLLSGIPLVLSKDVTSEHIRGRIREANEAIWEWFETVRKSLLEPSFSVQNTAGARLLVRPVVVERMRRIDQLQAYLGLDIDAISALVWDDTVDLLLRIEKACMDPECRRLAVYNITGPLGTEIQPDFFKSDGLRIRSLAGMSLVEKLFMARDALWKQHRISLNPAVAELPRGLPQGLPLHVAPSIWNLDTILPEIPDCFLLKKATQVVFADPDIVLQPLPQNEETREATKECHEDYNFCLLLLTKAQTSNRGKQQVLEQSFVYAVTVLSRPRLSQHEAEAEFRDNIFKDLLECHNLPAFPSLYPSTPFPQLPSSNTVNADSDVAILWDPNKLGCPPTFPRRELEHTVFDEMLYNSAHLNLRDGTLCHYECEFGEHCFMMGSPSVGGRQQRWAADVILAGCRDDQDSGFSVSTHSKDQVRSIREAQVAWHLMLFDEVYLKPKIGTSILELPFPNQNHVRYQNMTLARSFVNTTHGKMDDDRSMRHMLKHLGRHIPTTMLQDFTEKLMAAGDKLQLSKWDQMPTLFLQSLINSDRPGKAVPLVLRAVLDHPEDSSWHRVLFSQKFLRRLPAEDACKAMTDLATQILDRTGPRASKSEGSKPGVKITTVKLLAQALGQADSIPSPVAIDVLTQLLDRSDHVDVRFAALSSMLELVCSRPSTDDAVAEQLIPNLDKLVPVLAALDETQPDASQGTWTDDALPRVYEGTTVPSPDLHWMKTLPRTFELVIQTMKKRELWAPILMQRVVLPAIERSIEVNRRWLDGFLRRYSLSVEGLGLPVPPVKLEMLNVVLTRHAALTPDWIAELYCQILLFNIRPPAPVKEIHRKLKNTEDNAEKHWLASTQKPKRMDMGSPPFLADFVYGLAESASDKAAIPDVLAKRAYAISKAEEVLHAMLDDLAEPGYVDEQSHTQIMAQLQYQKRDRRKSEGPRRIAWQICLRPILVKVIAKVDRLRTAAWQRDPERRPRHLPDMFWYRLELLPFPAEEDGEEALSVQEKAKQCQAFADAVVDHVKTLVSRGTPYQDDLERLKGAITECAVEHQAAVALALGKLTSGDHVECLRVDLAAELLETASCTEKEVEEVKQMVRGWGRCEVEWIRDRLICLVGERSGRKMRDGKLERALREMPRREDADELGDGGSTSDSDDGDHPDRLYEFRNLT